MERLRCSDPRARERERERERERARESERARERAVSDKIQTKTAVTANNPLPPWKVGVVDLMEGKSQDLQAGSC